MFQIVFDLTFKMAFLLTLGYLIAGLGILESSARQMLTTLLLKVIVPFMVVMASQNDLSDEVSKALLCTGLVVIGTYTLGAAMCSLIAALFKIKGDLRRAFVSSCVFNNIAFLGFPICEAVYGGNGLLCSAFYAIMFNILFFSIGTAYLKNDRKIEIRAITHNINAIACTLSLVLYFAQVKFPSVLAGTFNYVSGMAFPLSMIVLGMNLADINLLDILRGRNLYAVSFIKLILVPGLVYVIMSALGFRGFIRGICTLMSTMPTATIVGIAAAEADCEPEFVLKAILQSTLFMLITLPVWILVINI